MINTNNAYNILRQNVSSADLKRIENRYLELSGLAEKLQRKNRQTKKENR